MPNLAIDGRALVGKRTGIGVHTAEIASRLSLSPPPLIATHREIADVTGIQQCRFDVTPSPLGVLWQQTLLTGVARRHECDVLWGPHGTLPLSLRIPSVITIHDLTSLTMPGRHRIRTILSFNLLISRSLHLATKIAAVSRHTADEVMRWFGIAASRITVTGNGVSDFFSPDTSEVDPLPGVAAGSYILYTGTIEPRKGVEDLLSAWERLAAPRPRLVLCGAMGWHSKAIEERISRYGGDQVLVTGYVSRETLRALYRAALVFVYPSLYEGFGMPPLEAMACGAPVVTTSAGALPEVMGDSVPLVRPGDPDALRKRIEAVRSQPSMRQEMSARGIEHSARFTWDRPASLMRTLIDDAASN